MGRSYPIAPERACRRLRASSSSARSSDPVDALEHAAARPDEGHLRAHRDPVDVGHAAVAVLDGPEAPAAPRDERAQLAAVTAHGDGQPLHAGVRRERVAEDVELVHAAALAVGEEHDHGGAFGGQRARGDDARVADLAGGMLARRALVLAHREVHVALRASVDERRGEGRDLRALGRPARGDTLRAQRVQPDEHEQREDGEGEHDPGQPRALARALLITVVASGRPAGQPEVRLRRLARRRAFLVLAEAERSARVAHAAGARSTWAPPRARRRAGDSANAPALGQHQHGRAARRARRAARPSGRSRSRSRSRAAS